MNTEITNVETLSPELQDIAKQFAAEQVLVQTDEETGATDEVVAETVTVQ